MTFLHFKTDSNERLKKNCCCALKSCANSYQNNPFRCRCRKGITQIMYIVVARPKKKLEDGRFVSIEPVLLPINCKNF